jgi:hypothetical protein
MSEPAVALTATDFARLMGWGTEKAAVKRAREWLDKRNVGVPRTKWAQCRWTISDMRAAAPGIVDEWISRGLIDV